MKFYAKDQKNQLKDHISFIRKNIKDVNDCYKNILTIYLHQDADINPSYYSLGGENLIKDKNENIMSYYLKMDYIWIKEWICQCIKIYEKNQLKIKNSHLIYKILFLLSNNIKIFYNGI
ncbi:PD-(D/E)XK nuclease family protein [Campylobacter molothri]|uniref:PD-(D/E)XK nuclease family protein n=1 Tax=Campylobacter molothri TaxID=1032242 RepID=UPI0039F24B44